MMFQLSSADSLVLYLPMFRMQVGNGRAHHGAFSETPAPSVPLPTHLGNGHPTCFLPEMAFRPYFFSFTGSF